LLLPPLYALLDLQFDLLVQVDVLLELNVLDHWRSLSKAVVRGRLADVETLVVCLLSQPLLHQQQLVASLVRSNLLLL